MQEPGRLVSRFSQVARWYQERPFYLQRDMLRAARLAGLRALGVQPSALQLDELDEFWSVTTSTTMRPRRGALELLEMLRARGLRIGLTGNADCREFAMTLANVGLEALADVALCSEEARSCKPDPMIFYEVLRRLDVRPPEALFVGTSADVDVRGARVVGMRSALLATGTAGSYAVGGFASDHLISMLSEVATLVTLPAPAGGPRARRRACDLRRDTLAAAR